MILYCITKNDVNIFVGKTASFNIITKINYTNISGFSIDHDAVLQTIFTVGELYGCDLEALVHKIKFIL